MQYAPPPARRRGISPMMIIGLIVLVLIGIGLYRYFTPDAPAQQTPPPPAVTVKEVSVENIPLVFEYPARLAGSREVEIRARVSGILMKRAYTEGQHVDRGDLLFEIDEAPYKAALEEAKANFIKAESDYRRGNTLMRQKALSAREFDQLRATYGSAKAMLDTAKINLAYTTVRAPISGYTSQEVVSEGSLVVADNTLLTRVTQLDPMYVEFAYPDSEAMLQRRAVANGSITLPADKLLTVEIVSKDGTVYDQEGKIRFTDSIISPDTGTVHARATIDNSEQMIMPGQFVRAKVKGMTQMNVISIPEKALMQGPQGMFVYTIGEENKAVVTLVELGLLNSGNQIITKGLKAGDKVITEGMIKVRPDAPVCIDTPQTPCGPKPASPAGATPAAVAKKDEAPAAASDTKKE